MSQDSTAADPTEVTIYGRTFRLRGSENEAYLRQLAEVVDGKMREVATATGTADTMKLAILACLNMADDYLRAKSAASEAEAQELDVARLVERLDEVLEV